ncbi:hypothetical protein [Methylopila sp. 73B]|uniref:hypothetical protein n=1 Tax=Methylopila sp. 73B TaxID=1120792 RepID=UPI00039CBFE5|nr:hypothetical protein [Methylopila sp. 73B]
MTAAEWIAAARASGVSVYLDPRPNARHRAWLSYPVHCPGLSDPEPYHPERWDDLDVERAAIPDEELIAALRLESCAAVPDG